MATNTTTLTDFEVSDDEQDDEPECACECDIGPGCFEHYEVAQ